MTLEAVLDDVRLITPDVARAEGRSRLTTENGDANEFHRFNALLVRKDGQWRIAEIRDYPMPVEDVSPYERLQELEWMVGDWVDEDADNKVTLQHPLGRQPELPRPHLQRRAPGAEGDLGDDVHRLGPADRADQVVGVRLGRGPWRGTLDPHRPNQWVVKAQGVLRDGRPTSATQIHTIVNKDAVKTSSIDRILGGQVAPDVPEILMVRKPPQPAVDATSPDPRLTRASNTGRPDP